MKFILSIFIISFSISNILFAQVQTIPAENPVYDYLLRMYLKEIIKDYDHNILPLSNEKVVSLLKEIESQSERLSSIEYKKALNYLDKFDPEKIDENPSQDFLFYSPYKHLYSYTDSSLVFIINPLLSAEFIHIPDNNNSSTLINIGGNMSGSYNNWFGFFLQGTNGFQQGDRSAALFRKDVSQSYTFTNTRLDYFDNTMGYVRFQGPHLNFELGRERVLWGTGYHNRLLLSDNPPVFDFMKFHFNYKSFSYDFIHGWLVRAPEFIMLDSVHSAKIKSSKYTAISRLGYRPSADLAFGISQAVVYSDRPFEAAYLNPFLFWESAQRSLNDLDNSYLILDARYKLFKAFEISSSLLVDDINLEVIKEGDWDHVQNSYAFQFGIIVTDPVLFENLTLRGEYYLIRPYVFSHRGFRESLSYSSNGYLLSPPVQPNSINISAGVTYDISFNLSIEAVYSNTRHGANIYDAEGNLVKNYGGNMTEPFGFYQDFHVGILDGIKETTDEFSASVNYEVMYGIHLQLFHMTRIIKTPSVETTDHIFSLGARLDMY